MIVFNIDVNDPFTDLVWVRDMCSLSTELRS